MIKAENVRFIEQVNTIVDCSETNISLDLPITPIMNSFPIEEESKVPHSYRENVLIVDDNFFNIEVLRNLIDTKQKKTVNVEHCLSGMIACDYIDSILRGEKSEYSIVFLDINMPHMNGFETS